MCFIVALCGLIGSSMLFIKCDTLSIAGVNAPYPNSSVPHQLSAPCNQACNCSGVSYSPVCDGPLNYYSPCHAGCSKANITSKDSVSYSDCACAGKSGDTSEQVKKGNCHVDCGLNFVLFMAIVSLLPILTFMNDTPAFIVTLRSVPPGQRSYALGLQMDLVRIFGSIPGPIIFGALLDKTCILWSSRCGTKGSCLEYDHDGLAIVLIAVMTGCKFITTTSFFLCWIFCRRLPSQAEETITVENDTKENEAEGFASHETAF